MLQCIVEITTDVCNNSDEIYLDLRPKLDMAIEFANDNNIVYEALTPSNFLRSDRQYVLTIKNIVSDNFLFIIVISHIS